MKKEHLFSLVEDMIKRPEKVETINIVLNNPVALTVEFNVHKVTSGLLTQLQEYNRDEMIVNLSADGDTIKVFIR